MLAFDHFDARRQTEQTHADPSVIRPGSILFTGSGKA